MQDETGIGGKNPHFQPTVWTQILQAQASSDSVAETALSKLIDLYWKPVYFCIRRNGHAVEDAKDLTQQFFTVFLERQLFRRVDRERGRFRTFLSASVRNFLCDEYDRRNAKKRQLNQDFIAANAQYAEDSSFERDWATVVLDRAFGRLREIAPREAHVVEAQRTGKTPYSELAEELETTEAYVKVMAHRGKRKLRAIIMQELSDTVSEPGDEVEELDALFRAFAL